MATENVAMAWNETRYITKYLMCVLGSLENSSIRCKIKQGTQTHQNEAITRKKNIINLKNNRIKDINPLSILDKGYSIVYCDGKISNKISNFKENKDLTIRVTDGIIHSKVKEIKKN